MEARRCLNLASRRIHSSSNVIDVTYPCALVVDYVLSGVKMNVGAQILEEWRYLTAKPITDLQFPSLITRLCKRVRMHQESRYSIVRCDKPFNPLRVKEAPGKDKRKRKTTLTEGDSGASTSRTLGPLKRIETEMTTMRLLLEGFPRPSSSRRPSINRPSTNAAAADSREMQGAIAALSQAHVELREDLEKEKKKRRSWDKLLVCLWKRVKVILKHISLAPALPR